MRLERVTSVLQVCIIVGSGWCMEWVMHWSYTVGVLNVMRWHRASSALFGLTVSTHGCAHGLFTQLVTWVKVCRSTK
jgi:hypothetical protein